MFKAALALSATLALSGCGLFMNSPPPGLRATNKALNFGVELPDEMVHRNVYGTVGFDEDYVGRYNKHSQNVVYTQGVGRGDPEYNYRVVRINMKHFDGLAIAFIPKGHQAWFTAAIVPDHIPRLSAGDIVEFRQSGTWDTLEGFLGKSDGNVVLALICKAGTPTYDQCVDALPFIGKGKATGPTGTPYPSSLSEYGFKYTPAYDNEGIAVRKW
jgi:hypothetical protein